MARLTVDLPKFRGADHTQCLFCEKDTRIRDGLLTSDGFVCWQGRDQLTLCDGCAANCLPRLLADLVPFMTMPTTSGRLPKLLSTER